MNPEIKKITEDVLSLPIHDRAKLAHIIISSLDEDTTAASVSAWELELEKRVRDIQSGKVKGVPAEEVFSKIRAKYH